MMNNKFLLKKCTAAILVFLFSLSSIAASYEVRNIYFEDQGENIVIRYDLSGDSEQKYKVNISLYDEEGRNFPLSPPTLSGDIGKDIQPGPNKKVIWRMVDDYPSGLEGDGFVFEVDARLQKKGSKAWLYIVGGAAVTGTAVAILSSSKEDKETEGNIKIKIDDNF